MDLLQFRDAHVYLTSLFLHFVRAAAFMSVTPIFGRQRDSLVLRLFLAVSLAAIFWWSGDKAVRIEGSLLGMGAMIAREAFLGFAIGFATYLLITVMISAGEIISHEMGFAMSRTMNPATGTNATVISQLFQVFGFLLILQLDLHHDVLRVLGLAYQTVPVGEPFDPTPIYLGLSSMVSTALLAAMQYAIPVVGVMVLLTAVLVMLARAVPHINLMEFSFGVRILLALGASAYFLTQGTPFLGRVFEGLIEQAAVMVGEL